jgi:hypothetical protein
VQADVMRTLRLRVSLPCASVVIALLLGPAAQAKTRTTFVSKRYGYSLALPGGSARFFTSHARSNWSGGGPAPSDPQFDQISDLKTHSLFMVAAEKLPAGWTLRRWASFTLSITVPPCHRKGPRTRTSSLGGARALVSELQCVEGIVVQLAAVHAGRGYFFVDLTANRSGTPHASDLRSFDSVRRAFEFSRG